MEFTAKQLADMLGGTVEGDENVVLSDFAKIEEGTKGKLSFLSNPKYTHYIYNTQASAVLVSNDFQPEQAVSTTLIRVQNSYEALAKLMQLAESMQPKKTGIHPTAVIAESAHIGDCVYIGAYAVIGENCQVADGVNIYPHVCLGDNVSIGESTKLYAGVKVYDDCKIGNRCILHAGAVIGSDGFGFAPDAEGVYSKIPQLGNVIIEDDVELGANTTVDCAPMGSTIIRKGVKIDNLCQIAHNVIVGEHTAMAAQSGIAGSTKIGAHCIFGGQSGAVGHITIADGVTLGAKGAFSNNIKKAGVYGGWPHQPIDAYRRNTVVERRLYEVYEKLNELEKKLNEEK